MEKRFLNYEAIEKQHTN